MSAVLHKAIRDAIREAPGYREKAILVSEVLEATTDVAGREEDLYSAVHRLFSAMPMRLVHGSIFLVTTEDVEDGVELAWDAREEPRPGFASGQGLYAPYEADEPVALALRELERACRMRAGHVRATHESVSNSSSFPRAPYVHRRVVAHLPLPPELAEARARQAVLDAAAPRTVTVRSVLQPKPRQDERRSLWPAAGVPVARVGARQR